MARLIGASTTLTNITQDAVITTFNSSGNWTGATHTTQAWVVVVAGGAGGAMQGSGGGAGGYLEVPAHPVPSNAVPITIGGGGAGGADGGQGGINENTRGKAGGNSVFGAASPLTAIGGGGGVRGVSGTPRAGQDGGSGGGGYRGGPSAAAGGAGTSGQGNAGGSAIGGNTGGGGGASAEDARLPLVRRLRRPHQRLCTAAPAAYQAVATSGCTSPR